MPTSTAHRPAQFGYDTANNSRPATLGMAEQAVRTSPELLWPAVADRYREIPTRLVAAGLAEAS